LRDNYFSATKQLKRVAKRKKHQFKQNFMNKLLETKGDNPQEMWKLLRKASEYSSNNKIDAKLDPNDSMKHFQSQGDWKENTDPQHEAEICDFLSNEEKYSINGTTTDKPFTISDVKNVIKSLKTGRSSGPDFILNEIFKGSCPLFVKAITNLFNMIFSSGVYPTSWLSSCIVPIHKSGDPFDPNKYRDISPLNGIAKLFSVILNNRIMLHMKDKFSNVQFGFRPNMRTADSLFIFKTLINKYFNLLKKPIYSCFIDLRKAFDSVWHNGLFSKLQSSGMGARLSKLFVVCILISNPL
jgi:hypothetical protein